MSDEHWGYVDELRKKNYALHERAQKAELRVAELEAALSTLEAALSRAPCSFPYGAEAECTEGDPCLTHATLSPWAAGT